jgi:hypothetical protein
MSYFNTLAAAEFQTADNDDIVWYPWRKWGKAYKVPTSEHRAEIQKRIKMFYITVMITQVILAQSLEFYIIILFVPWMIWYRSLTSISSGGRPIVEAMAGTLG